MKNMRKQINKLKEKLRLAATRLFCGTAALLQDQEGIGTVEVVLLILVAVGLVLIFRERIEELVTSVFDKITSKANSL